MKIWFKIFFGLIAILILTVSYLVMYRVGPRVERAIKTVLPAALGTEVTIDHMTVLPLHGSIQFLEVSIANPEKFHSAHIATAQEINIVVSLRSLLSDTLVLKKIEIQEPTFNYEKRFRHDNFSVIAQNVKDYLAKRKDEKTEAQQASDADKPKHKVIIKRFVITGGKVNAKITGLPTAPIILQDIELDDIGKDTGGTTWGIAGRAMGGSITDAVREVISSLRGATRVALKGTGTAVRDSSGKVIGHVTDAGSIVLDGTVDTGEKVVEGASDAGHAILNTATHAIGGIEALFTRDKEE